jgi:hypothetical protein
VKLRLVLVLGPEGGALERSDCPEALARPDEDRPEEVALDTLRLDALATEALMTAEPRNDASSGAPELCT